MQPASSPRSVLAAMAMVAAHLDVYLRQMMTVLASVEMASSSPARTVMMEILLIIGMKYLKRF